MDTLVAFALVIVLVAALEARHRRHLRDSGPLAGFTRVSRDDADVRRLAADARAASQREPEGVVRRAALALGAAGAAVPMHRHPAALTQTPQLPTPSTAPSRRPEAPARHAA